MIKFDVKITDLHINEYRAFNPIEEMPAYNGKINITSSLGLNVETKRVAVLIKVDMLVNEPGGHPDGFQLIGTIETVTHYDVEEEWSRFEFPNEKEVRIPDELDNFLVNIAYNNTRGLLKEKGKDDLVGRMLLPLVDPADIKRGNLI